MLGFPYLVSEELISKFMRGFLDKIPKFLRLNSQNRYDKKDFKAICQGKLELTLKSFLPTKESLFKLWLPIMKEILAGTLGTSISQKLSKLKEALDSIQMSKFSHKGRG